MEGAQRAEEGPHVREGTVSQEGQGVFSLEAAVAESALRDGAEGCSRKRKQLWPETR